MADFIYINQGKPHCSISSSAPGPFHAVQCDETSLSIVVHGKCNGVTHGPQSYCGQTRQNGSYRNRQYLCDRRGITAFDDIAFGVGDITESTCGKL